MGLIIIYGVCEPCVQGRGVFTSSCVQWGHVSCNLCWWIRVNVCLLAVFEKGGGGGGYTTRPVSMQADIVIENVHITCVEWAIVFMNESTCMCANCVDVCFLFPIMTVLMWNLSLKHESVCAWVHNQLVLAWSPSHITYSPDSTHPPSAKYHKFSTAHKGNKCHQF